MLAGFGPINSAGCLDLSNNTIQLFYSDEHALTLGVRQTVINGKTTNFTVATMGSNPDHAHDPAVGATGPDGEDTNTCGFPDCGRPLRPVLFVTDVTDPLGPLAGDWQSGDASGTNVVANNPTDVFGTWKAAVRTVSGTTITVTPDADPAKNTTLGTGSDPVPAGITNLGYLAEVRWDLANLVDRFGNPLVAGHVYRFEFMVHDGDQNKTGGDAGENCVTVLIPAGFTPNLTPTPTPVPPTPTPTPTPTPLPAANTSVSVSCDPSSIALHSTTACTVTVTNTSALAPYGAPQGTSNPAASSGTISPDPCTLATASATTSTCVVSFTPSKTGNQTIKASYSSSNTAKWKNAGNSPNFTVVVSP